MVFWKAESLNPAGGSAIVYGSIRVAAKIDPRGCTLPILSYLSYPVLRGYTTSHSQ